MLVALVIPISCLNLLYFRGTWGLLISYPHSPFSFWFYSCSYSRTGIFYIVGLFFPLSNGNQNKYIPFPHRTNEDSCCFIGTPCWTLLYIKALQNLYLVLLWVTKLEKHKLFTLTKSKAVAPNQLEYTHFCKAACQPMTDVLLSEMPLKSSMRSPVGPNFHNATSCALNPSGDSLLFLWYM